MKSESPNIFEFVNARSFLSAVIEAKKAKNPRFSIRAWAKIIGFKNHTLLSLILNQKRPLSQDYADKIQKNLQLNETESKYFSLMLLHENAETTQEKTIYLRLIKQFHVDMKSSILEMEHFHLIENFHTFAIAAMFDLKRIKADESWIEKQLCFPVTQKNITKAIDQLIAAGLLEKDRKGLKKKQSVFTLTDIPHQSIKQYHRQALEVASQSLDNTSVEKREFNSYTMAVNTEKLAEAKKMIRSFQKELIAFLEENPGDEVYQFQMQLFPLTKTKL